MHLIEHVHPGLVILEPREQLTVENELDLRQAVKRHLEAGRVHLVLDLASVPYIDSCGLGTIAQTHLSTHRLGGWLRLLNVSGRNRQLLTVTRLLDVIGVYEPARAAASA
jgi:anti-anti-sigma factor